MAIQKKTMPAKSDKKTETTKTGKPSTKVGSSDAVTPSLRVPSSFD